MVYMCSKKFVIVLGIEKGSNVKHKSVSNELE